MLARRPVNPAVPPLDRPWQAGRVHLDGVRWEAKTWPPEDRIAFRDRVAGLLEFTVPGNERWEARNLPLVTCPKDLEALQSPSPEMAAAAR